MRDMNDRRDMTDFSSPPDEPSSDPIQFEEWLELTAESRGVTEEEVLEQLISSYWTLNEMSEMIQGSEEAEEPDEPFSHPVSESFTPVTRSEFEEFEAEILERIDDIGARTAALEAEVEAPGDVSAADLEQRLDEEFDTIRTILRHLIDATEDNEDGLAALEARIEEGVSEFREQYSRLAHLKQQAMSLDIASADCDYCGTTVDLSMLLTPQCPNCGRTFTGVEPRRRVLGIGLGSDTLTVEPPSARRRGGSPDDEDKSPKTGGFVWGPDH